MEITTPLIPLLSFSGLARPAGQPPTAQVFADLVKKGSEEAPVSILPESDSENIGDIEVLDEVCQEIMAHEIDFSDTKVDGESSANADQEIAIGPETVDTINPVGPPLSLTQPVKITPGVSGGAVQPPAKQMLQLDVDIPEQEASITEVDAPRVSWDTGLEIVQSTEAMQGIGRQGAVFNVPEMLALPVVEAKQALAVVPLSAENANPVGDSSLAYVGRLHLLPASHITPLAPQERQLARSAISQISEMVQQTQDRGFELRLKPPELGVVRIQFSYSEGGLIVHVAAERSETSELIRRHADMLLQEFRQIGYSDQPTLSFGRHTQRQALFDAPQADQPPSFQSDETQHPLSVPVPRLLTSGLNIVM